MDKSPVNKISIREISVSDNALFEEFNKFRDTAGYLEQKADKSAVMGIRYNKAHGTAKKSEIFVHELVHFMISRALKSEPKYAQVIANMQAEVRKQLEANYENPYEIFLQNILRNGKQPTSIEIQIAKDKYDYSIGKYADPEEFLAYAVSNEDLFAATAELKAPQEIIDSLELGSDGKFTTSFKKLINAFIKIINSVWSGEVAGKKQNNGDLIADVITKLAEIQYNLDVEDEIQGAKENDNNWDKIDNKLSPFITKFDNKIISIHTGVKKKESLKKLMEKLKDVAVIGRVIESNLLQSIITTITKKTDNNKWAHIFKLYRQSKNQMEKHRQGLSDAIKEVVEVYVEDEDPSTRNAISTVIFNTDLAAVFTGSDGDLDYKTLISALEPKGTELNTLHSKALTELKNAYAEKGRSAIGDFTDTTTEFAHDIAQAYGLGKMMATGVASSNNQQINASNIYNKFYRSKLELDSVTQEYMPTLNIADRTITDADKELIAKLDRFITLEALKQTSDIDKAIIHKYLSVEKNSKNMKSLLHMHRDYVARNAKSLKVSNFEPVQKGYFDQLNEQNMTFELVPESELSYYTGKIGRMKDMGAYGTINGIKYHKVSGYSYETSFDEGMLSIAGNAIPGKSLKGLLAEQIRESEQKKRRGETKLSTNQINETVEEQMVRFANSGGSDTSILGFDGEWNAIPTYDMKGRIIDYKLDISRQEKVQHLKADLDVVKSAAYSFSKFNHREASTINNNKVIDALIEYGSDNVDEADDFVILEKHTEGDFDESVNGRWNQIPEYTRKYIFEKTGMHRIAIPKDMVEMITGEKGVTIGNFNFGPLDLRNHKRLRKIVMNLEGLYQEILLWFKETIVVRTGGVVMGNLISNMMVAWMKAGIDPIEFLKEANKKWSQLNEFTKIEKELELLRVKQSALGEDGHTLNTKIKALKGRREKNSFSDLVNDGQFSSIIEDVNVGDAPKGRISNIIEDFMTHKNMPKAVNSAKEFLFVDKNTTAFKSMMKLTQYGDIITRQIMKEKIERDAVAKGNPLGADDRQDLLNYLDQLFVNYTYIDNKFLRYSEKSMGVMFTKYFFRQAKAVQTLIASVPSRYGTMLGAEYVSGLDIDSPDNNYFNPIDSLYGRFYSPERLFDQLEIPPIRSVFASPADAFSAQDGLFT
ncbi:MAG: hypothetical protein KAH01_07935 [Caldisericia bacterium]|nr:hypothetical protein [Caldisericia bacterium]